MCAMLINALCAAALAISVTAAAQEGTITPVRRSIDLKEGETASVILDDGSTAGVTLVDVVEERDTVRGAVRKARVTVEINGARAEIVSATYHLPVAVGGVLVDCPITRGYYDNANTDAWGLTEGADARIRLWPAGSPYIREGTFTYPARYRWFASRTQMSNEPVYVDGGEMPDRKTVYYHYGLDIGGAEGMVDVISATDALVVSKAGEVLDGHDGDTPVSPRYDVIYLLDERGWYYRYSHLKSFETNVILGGRVSMGQKLGEIGKEGGSGGWTHLHFGIKARQPSGKWGTEDGYAYFWQSYMEKYDPAVIAVARPHLLAAVGERVTLDGGKSASLTGGTLSFEWLFPDGAKSGPVQTRVYDTPGVYSEILRVTDGRGNTDYDFAMVNVVDPADPKNVPPTIHAAYSSTFGIRAGDPVTFKTRVFRSGTGGETWDFGDGSPTARTVSHPGDQHLPDGYAETVHRFREPGYYIVTVTHTAANGFTATTHLDVLVEE